ncbi:hypothetical protein ACFL5B_03205, partial [Candidatus Latescibacterota bacterium]
MDENNRRTGHDRRGLHEDIEAEKRKVRDRRTVIKDNLSIINILKKLPIFRGFTNYQYQQILNICSKKI